MPITLLNPNPIPARQHRTDPHGRHHRNRPRRRQEQQIHHQQHRRHSMEPHIYLPRQLIPARSLSSTPVPNHGAAHHPGARPTRPRIQLHPIRQNEFPIDLLPSHQHTPHPPPHKQPPRQLTTRNPQYSKLINTSNGALHKLSAFFAPNTRRLPVISATEPHRNVSAASASPTIVRYCRCQP